MLVSYSDEMHRWDVKNSGLNTSSMKKNKANGLQVDLWMTGRVTSSKPQNGIGKHRPMQEKKLTAMLHYWTGNPSHSLT